MQPYINNEVQVEAAQWRGSLDLIMAEAPNVLGYQHNANLVLSVGGREYVLFPGDWLVRFADGLYQIFSADSFERLFVPAQRSQYPKGYEF